MWKRSELKERAKTAFKRNYWKTVLISLLLTLLVGGSGGLANEAAPGGSDNSEVTTEAGNDKGTKELEESVDKLTGVLDEPGGVAAVVVGVSIFFIIFIAIFALYAVLSAFVINPIAVGCGRFFLRNLNEPAQVGNVGYAFDNNYKNIAKTMFFRDMYTFFWTLLFVIPGIVKVYEYRMIPYLLADNPQMTKEQAFAESRRMMKGQKWRAFVLDLSFIGWYILSAITLGIVGIFYVMPYVNQTRAALYEALRYGSQAPEVNGPVFNQEQA